MPGRTDASQEQTDVNSFDALRPKADGFRNYFDTESHSSPAEMLVDKSDLLSLTVPEMTALVGGMRVLDANSGQSQHGVFTKSPGQLSNDFFVNLLDNSTIWVQSSQGEGLYEGQDRDSKAVKWTATPVDLIFGSNSELRAIAEVYASSDGEAKLVKDFVAAWSKVMTADRYELDDSSVAAEPVEAPAAKAAPPSESAPKASGGCQAMPAAGWSWVGALLFGALVRRKED